MVKTVATFLLGLCLAWAPACGRKGPLQLPQGREPMPVEGLTAVLGDGAVLLHWTNPVKAVSGRPVAALERIEVWVFERDLPAGERPIAADRVERTARLVRSIPRSEFAAAAASAGPGPGGMAYSYPLAAAAAGPAKLVFTVRVLDRKGRVSDFAPPVAVDIPRRAGGVGPSNPGRCILGGGGRA
jgi:predicted small lipoprotein YifL